MKKGREYLPFFSEVFMHCIKVKFDKSSEVFPLAK